ncbi:hypothetical protein CEXT_74721 [Caerostris extrusa]|uniref:Uncharacterized protein n=1 Tax=Caerostris extrusa TaxID=172846 RepID=A0AAV4T847_CAEEX|nr:hypothetical protein CEXT_74721 [Caerostris extrusa]
MNLSYNRNRKKDTLWTSRFEQTLLSLTTESMQGQPTPTQAWNGPFEIRFSMGPCPFGPPYGQAGAMNQKLLLPSQSNK